MNLGLLAANFLRSLGYKVVHAYEKWSWIPCFIIFLIVLGEFAHSGVSLVLSRSHLTPLPLTPLKPHIYANMEVVFL
jgi:purine-cytosine permease-like protein